MEISLQGICVHYDVRGAGQPILLLHGWGANRFTFNRLSEHLEENFTVYCLDLPGFGDTIINIPYSVLDVAYIIHDFVIALEINNPIILGHSYGGRIAIAYASMYDCNKLVLVDSAGLKKKLKMRKKINIMVYKLAKRIKKNIAWGSSDYRNASALMKRMLVMTVNTDLRPRLAHIKAPTLLIYGKNDKITPVSDGLEICRNISNASLVTMESCGHFSYLDRPAYFEIILDAFIVGKNDE